MIKEEQRIADKVTGAKPHKEVRSYEVSLWTLQDEFITVLKWSDVEQKGRIEDPKMTLSIDGTESFSFSIPMYIDILEEGDRYNPSLSEPPHFIRKENPIWYNTRNGNLIEGMRKIKVIINKNDPIDEEIYEFLIIKVTEEHTEDVLTCKVECEGLAFHELGKIGYKYSLKQDNFEVEYKKWAEGNRETDPPIQNVQYWCKEAGLEPLPTNVGSILNPNIWYYEIRMNYGSFGGERDSNKVYEDEYVSEWSSDLKPIAIQKYMEKARAIDIENSNIYNITQQIAETFEIYCRYEYKHDDNGHIVGKVIIFYNNYLQEEKDVITLLYPYTSKAVSREMDSTELTTKLYVTAVEDDTTLDGSITILDTDANKMREDYLFNFDYLKETGAISQEQYDEIAVYEKKIKTINDQLIPQATLLNSIDNKITDLKAKIKVAEEGKTLAEEQVNYNSALASQLDQQDGDADGYITRSVSNPRQALIIRDKNNRNVIRLSNIEKGIVTSTVRVWKNYSSSNLTCSDEVTGFSFETDEYNNVTYIIGLTMEENDSNIRYLTFKYKPQLYYDNIIAVWISKKAKDTETYDSLSEQLGTGEDAVDPAQKTGLYLRKYNAEQLYNSLLEEKQKVIKTFERLMGPALREGYWQPDDYNDFGERKEAKINFSNTRIAANLINDTKQGINVGWDIELDDDEDDIYYKYGTLETKKYYPCIDLTNLFSQSDFREHIVNKEVSVIYKTYYTNIESGDTAKYYQSFGVGSKALLKFICNQNGTIIPVLLLVGAKTMTDSELNLLKSSSTRLGKFEVDALGQVRLDNSVTYATNLTFITLNDNYKMVYPRVKWSSLKLKDNSNDLTVFYNNTLLQRYEDYYTFTRITTRNELDYLEYFLTIKPESMWKCGTYTGQLVTYYVLSNANTAIYLDAKDVLKENAYPKVSYTVTVNVLNLGIIRTLCSHLAQLVKINDTELKLNNVFGYISKIELDLDFPANDSIEVKNYKTKFEDLFSSIVASTDSLQRNRNGITAAITGGVGLNNIGLIDTINGNYSVLQAYLDSYFDSSEVVREKLRELFTDAGKILSDSRSTLNNIASLNTTNAFILSDYLTNITDAITPMVYRGTRPTKFKAGDIWIDDNGNRYIATVGYSEAGPGATGGFIKTYNGAYGQIIGSGVNYDAVAGKVDISATNKINIQTNGLLTLTGTEGVDIYSNKVINIGGQEINIGAAQVYTKDNNNNWTYAYESGVLSRIQGGINLVATQIIGLDEAGNKIQTGLPEPQNINASSAVHILPTKITMTSAKILNVSINDQTNDVSAISISADDGIWVGTTQGITFYAAGGLSYSSIGETIVENVDGAVSQINRNHILFGITEGNAGSAFELTKDYMIMASGTMVNSSNNSSKRSTGVTGSNDDLIGVKITKDSIGLATISSNTTNAILMNSAGITLGSATNGINLTSSTSTLKNITDGSFVRIAPDGVSIGSLGNFYLNTNNIKLQSDSTYATRFAIGSNLKTVTNTNGVNTDNINSVSSMSTVNLVLNNNGLFIKGKVFADEFITATLNNIYFKANSSNFGFYNNSNTGLLTFSSTGMTCAGSFNLSATNILINSAATGSNAMFRLGTTSAPVLTYSPTGGMNINTTSFTINSQSFSTYVNSVVDVSDNRIWLGVKNSTNHSNFTITDTSLVLSTGTSGTPGYNYMKIATDEINLYQYVTIQGKNEEQYIRMNSSGLSIQGSSVKINGKDAWTRGDIIYADSQPTWPTDSSGAQLQNWVWIKPVGTVDVSFSGGSSRSSTTMSMESGGEPFPFDSSGTTVYTYSYHLTMWINNNALYNDVSVWLEFEGANDASWSTHLGNFKFDSNGGSSHSTSNTVSGTFTSTTNLVRSTEITATISKSSFSNVSLVLDDISFSASRPGASGGKFECNVYYFTK